MLGKQIFLETDHKPLILLLTYKHLDNLPPWVLRFRLRLMRFDYHISHVPGKYLYAADAFSRAPTTHNSSDEETKLQEEVEWFMLTVKIFLTYQPVRNISRRSISSKKGTLFAANLTTYLITGWPNKHLLPRSLKCYWTVRAELSLHEGLLLYGSCIVIPTSLQKQILQKIHHGHQGIQKCRCKKSITASKEFKSVALEYPCLYGGLESLKPLKHSSRIAPQCVKCYVPPKEPLLTSPLPGKP